jgi:hypothetical protein
MITKGEEQLNFIKHYFILIIHYFVITEKRKLIYDNN